MVKLRDNKKGYAFLVLCCIFGFSKCKFVDCQLYENEIYSGEFYQKHIDLNFINKMKSYLNFYDEPMMSDLDYESYRLSIDRTHKSDTSHIIRMERNSNGEVFLIHKKLISNSTPGKTIVGSKKKQCSLEDWNSFIDLVYRSKYWMLPREVDREGLHGSIYYIEGRRPRAENCGKRGYHIVRRWSPKEKGVSDLIDGFINFAESGS